jgi:hypothetical protein
MEFQPICRYERGGRLSGKSQQSPGSGVDQTGATDIIVDYYHAIQLGLPAMPGQLGATYAIPIIYVPLLMITHVGAFYLLVRPRALGG